MKTAREILYQVDKDGIRKYWIGTFGTEKKMDLKDVYRAMEEYASQRTVSPEPLNIKRKVGDLIMENLIIEGDAVVDSEKSAEAVTEWILSHFKQ